MAQVQPVVEKQLRHSWGELLVVLLAHSTVEQHRVAAAQESKAAGAEAESTSFGLWEAGAAREYWRMWEEEAGEELKRTREKAQAGVQKSKEELESLQKEGLMSVLELLEAAAWPQQLVICVCPDTLKVQ